MKFILKDQYYFIALCERLVPQSIFVLLDFEEV